MPSSAAHNTADRRPSPLLYAAATCQRKAQEVSPSPASLTAYAPVAAFKRRTYGVTMAKSNLTGCLRSKVQETGAHSFSASPACCMSAMHWQRQRLSASNEMPSLRLGLLSISQSYTVTNTAQCMRLRSKKSNIFTTVSQRVHFCTRHKLSPVRLVQSVKYNQVCSTRLNNKVLLDNKQCRLCRAAHPCETGKAAHLRFLWLRAAQQPAQ